MASEALAIKGIILFSEEYKDKDRMLTILTSTMGIIKACAKSTGKQNSKLAFLSVPFMLVDFTLSDSHGFWYVKEALIIESNSGIMNSLEAMAVANHISDVLSKAVMQTDVSHSAYELAVYALYVLGINPQNYKSVYAAFNLKFLLLSGFATTFDNCSNCGNEISKFGTLYIDLEGCQIFCEECKRVTKNSNNLFKLSLASLNVINYYISKPVNSIFTLTVAENIQDEVRRFSTKFISVQLDEEFRDPIESIKFPVIRINRD